jgi:hypothetical protein
MRNMASNLNFFAIDFDTRGAKIADWVLSAASLGWAGWLLWSGDVLWGSVALGAGLLGCFMSWWRPLPRVQRWMRDRFIKRRA